MNEHPLYSMMIQWSDEDQAYLVILPEWSDRVIGGPAVTHGASYEDAVNRGREALNALIASARKHNEPLPHPHIYAHV